MRPTHPLIIFRAELPHDALVEVHGIADADRPAFADWLAVHLAPDLRCSCEDARKTFDWIADTERECFALPIATAHLGTVALGVAPHVVERLRAGERAAA